jgi:hypothetical protein
MIAIIVLFPLYVLLAGIVAVYAERRKKIGLWWALFFSLTLSPIVGFLLALGSGSKSKSWEFHDLFIRITAIIAIPVLIIAFLILIIVAHTESKYPVILLLAGSGLLGLGIYVIKEIRKTNYFGDNDNTTL